MHSRELFPYLRHYLYQKQQIHPSFIGLWHDGRIKGDDQYMTSDESLMLEFQCGSHEALEELFARYRDPLYGFFHRRLESKQRAEDLVQETFLAVIRAASRYQPRSLVRTYLYSIAMKLVISERRKRGGQFEPLDSAHELGTTTAPEAVLWVKQAVTGLELLDREVLMLREYEQLSYCEIAELLRIPVNTVRSRLFRARMALRELLDPQLKIKPEPPEAAANQSRGVR